VLLPQGGRALAAAVLSAYLPASALARPRAARGPAPRVALELTSAQRRPQAFDPQAELLGVIWCSKPASGVGAPPVRRGTLHPVSALS